jgi:hypothetical protein
VNSQVDDIIKPLLMEVNWASLSNCQSALKLVVLNLSGIVAWASLLVTVVVILQPQASLSA